MDKAAELIRERDRRVSIAFWLSILFCPFIPKGLALGYYHRQTLGTHILLWLRKFHGNKRSTLTLAEALSMACRGLGVCVTLRDSVVGSNPHKPVSLILLNIYLCLLLGLPWLFVVIAFDDISIKILASYCVMACFMVTARYLSRHYEISYDWKSSVSRLVRVIRKRAGGVTHLSAVKCPDDLWQDVIRALLVEADAVIFDSAALTDSLAIEFRWALDNLGPRKIIVAMPSGESVSGNGDGQLRCALQKEYGFAFDYVGWFSYSPSTNPHSLAVDLEMAVAKALTYPPRRAGVGTGSDTPTKGDKNNIGSSPEAGVVPTAVES